MTAVLANEPTAAAVLATMPCYPIPPSGASPAIDALRAARSGHGLAIGSDGMTLILRRPWLALDVPITGPAVAYLPYGSAGEPRAEMLCGRIPAVHFGRIFDHFLASLPNEAAAFVVWHEETGEFAVKFPVIDDASPSSLVYRPPALPPGWHLICDIHSHGRLSAFFSATDDADDRHVTKIAMVAGNIGNPGGHTIKGRICAAGMFLPLPRSPFDGGDDAA